jgi:uncharacterized protein YbjT (DUF2867 family)
VILVTGATGNVGSELAHLLAARGAGVRAVVRNPDGAPFPAAVDVVSGDLTRPETVAPALKGVRRVFLLGGFATTELLGHMRDAGVAQVVVLTSRCVIGGHPDNAITRMWLDAEAAVRGSGMAWTILRPSGFHSNALRWRPQLRRGDVVRTPWANVPIASIDPADIAAVAATVLTEPGHQAATAVLSGPQPLTPGEQVTILARVLGRPLRYEPLADTKARAQMAADTPALFVDALFRFFTDGEFDDSVVVPSVLEITRHPPRTFEQWAQAHSDAFTNDAMR